MQTRTRSPNFFVVGAAKSGTTALWYYLGQHPDCYLAPVKEPHRWAEDLRLGSHPFLSRHPELFLPTGAVDFWSARMAHVDAGLGTDPASYPSLYAAAGDQQAVGEADPAYLLSEAAAGAIARAHPDARIVIVLRHPVEVMHSLHAMLRLGAQEPHWDFAEAVAASREREVGDPPGHEVWARYLDVVRFAPQVRRYLDAFPRGQVHVSLFDDLRADVAGWVQEVQAFLGLAPQRPPDLRPANDSQRARSTRLHRLLLDPPPRAARVVHRLPTGLRVRAVAANMRPLVRDPLPPDLRRDLTAELAPDIRELAGLIDRDLSHWLV